MYSTSRSVRARLCTLYSHAGFVDVGVCVGDALAVADMLGVGDDDRVPSTCTEVRLGVFVVVGSIGDDVGDMDSDGGVE